MEADWYLALLEKSFSFIILSFKYKHMYAHSFVVSFSNSLHYACMSRPHSDHARAQALPLTLLPDLVPCAPPLVKGPVVCLARRVPNNDLKSRVCIGDVMCPSNSDIYLHVERADWTLFMSDSD